MDVQKLIDQRDTPLIAKLGLNSAEDKMDLSVEGYKISLKRDANVFNYTSIVQKAIMVKGEEKGLEDELIYQAGKAIPHLLRLVERAAFHGKRVRGDATTPRGMGGLKRMSLKTHNSAGIDFIQDDVDLLLSELVDPDLLIMNPRTATAWRNRFGMKDCYQSLEIVEDRWCPTDTAHVLQSDTLGFHTMREFETMILSEETGLIKAEVVGEFSLLASNVYKNGFIDGIVI